MAYLKDTYCSYCGERFHEAQGWPRQCGRCGNISYRNPLPVAVLVVPVDMGNAIGVVTIRRNVAPCAGQLALPGGYIEVDESWQAAATRELYEEAGVVVDPASVRDFMVRSAPDGTVIIFGCTEALPQDALPTFTPTPEASERAILVEPVELAFPLHTAALAAFLAANKGMADNLDPMWLQWARQLQAIAQNGFTYALNPYDLERYEQVRHVATAMMAAGAGATVERIAGLFAGETGYATPKVDTRAAVFREGTLLLVRELADGGRWTLPGGWADVNEAPSEAVVREVFEESGFETRAVKLLAVYDRSLQGHQPPFAYHVYKLFFRCEIAGGAATTSMETGEVAFFHEDEIPELSMSRVTPRQIARLFDHFRHPEWPTDFD